MMTLAVPWLRISIRIRPGVFNNANDSLRAMESSSAFVTLIRWRMVDRVRVGSRVSRKVVLAVVVGEAEKEGCPQRVAWTS